MKDAERGTGVCISVPRAIAKDSAVCWMRIGPRWRRKSKEVLNLN